MTEQFLEQNCVPHEIAKSLKEIGFDEECIGFYSTNGEIEEFVYYDTDRTNSALATVIEYYNTASTVKEDCTAPLFNQVFDWFDKLDIYGRIEWEIIGSDEWGFTHTVKYLPKNAKNEKRRCSHVVSEWSFQEDTGIYSGGWSTDKEARVECIKKMIEIYKEQNK